MSKCVVRSSHLEDVLVELDADVPRGTGEVAQHLSARLELRDVQGLGRMPSVSVKQRGSIDAAPVAHSDRRGPDDLRGLPLHHGVLDPGQPRQEVIPIAARALGFDARLIFGVITVSLAIRCIAGLVARAT